VPDLPDQQSFEHESVFCVRIGTWAGVSGAGFLAWQDDQDRQKKMQKGLPDVLDLLVICIEAGLSLDRRPPDSRGAEECAARAVRRIWGAGA